MAMPTARSTARSAAPGSTRTVGRRRPSLVTVRRLALVSLVANIGIVATGGLVRLTNSGLGCPTWPRCESGDFVPTKALSWHGAIEFGNRMLTGVVLAAAVAVFVAALRLRPSDREIRRWAWVTLLGIPAQIVMGGLVTLTKLNPWVVAPHFLLSMMLIGASTVLWWRTRAPKSPSATLSASPPIPRLVRLMAAAVWGVTYLVFTIGTAVTGSGPHAGDATAVRLPFRPAAISQLHADLVMLLVGLAVSLAAYVSAVGAAVLVRRTTRVLVAALGFQAAVGFAQYFSGLPVGLVELHVAGAAVVAAAVTAVVLALGDGKQEPG
jgi:cytochrome c oxidase assembly protein subunit 15